MMSWNFCELAIDGESLLYEQVVKLTEAMKKFEAMLYGHLSRREHNRTMIKETGSARCQGHQTSTYGEYPIILEIAWVCSTKAMQQHEGCMARTVR